MKKNKKASSPGKFFLCGAGLSFLEDMTLETARVLRDCDVVFYIHRDYERAQQTLERVCPGVRVEFADYKNTSSAALWKKMEAELKKGGRVAYLDYGNPLLFSDGGKFTDRCRRLGYAFRVVPALSAVESILAVLVENGLQVRDDGYSVLNADYLRAHSAPLPSARLLLIFCACEALKKYGKAVLAPIERCYPKDHPVYLVRSADIMGKTAFSSLKVKDLRASAGLIEHRMSVILSPL
jgi:siroheme synthase